MGAVDYINKPINPDLVKARVNTQINLKLMRDKLVMLAATDGLTGLANRFHFDGMLAYEYARHLRSGEELALIMLDIDQFQGLQRHLRPYQWRRMSPGGCQGDDQDRLPHHRPRGSVWRRRVRSSFAGYVPQRSRGYCRKSSRTALATLPCRKKIKTRDMSPPVWAWLAEDSSQGSSIVDVLTEADIQLYRAKAGGRNRVAFRAIEKSGADALELAFTRKSAGNLSRERCRRHPLEQRLTSKGQCGNRQAGTVKGGIHA